METRNSTATNGILPRLVMLFSKSDKHEGIAKALMALSLSYQQRVELTRETQAIYLESLETLSPAQLALAFSRAEMEPNRFFPSPGELRALAGCLTAAQSSEQEARDGLEWILRKIREHGPKLGPKRGELLWPGGHHDDGRYHPETYERLECQPVPEKVRATITLLGNGDFGDGMLQLARHPGFASKNDEYDSFGLQQSAVEKFEKRWLRTWEQAKTETALAPAYSAVS